MAYTIHLHKHQSVIWQEDECPAILLWPEASGNLTWLAMHQGEDAVNLSLDGAKELIKQLQWFVKNQDTVIKNCKA